MLTVSEFSRQEIVRTLGIPAEKIVVTHESAGGWFAPTQTSPVPREPLELSCEPMSAAQVTGYEQLAEKIMAGPGVYRKAFRSKRGAG